MAVVNTQNSKNLNSVVSSLSTKTPNLHGRQSKNAGAGTDPNDLVTLSQVQTMVAAATGTGTTTNLAKQSSISGSSVRVFSLQKLGTLAIQSDCVGHLFILENQTVSIVRADIETAPTGASFICKVYQNSTLWATLTITATNSSVVLSSGTVAGLAQLVAGNYLRLDITQVGSTIPGSNLTVTIQ
jgi:hypothetical protein